MCVRLPGSLLYCAVLFLCCATLQVSYDVVETDRGVQAANVSGPDGEPLNRTRDVFAPETDVFGDAGDGSDFDDTFSDADQAQK